MNVFVTGGTGLLGNHLIAELLAQGHEVAALVRDTAKATRVLPSSPQLTTVMGDMGDADDWLPALAGKDAVIHAAAYFREAFGRGDHTAKLQALNVDLPVRLAREAARCGVRKTVIVSSSGVVYRRADGSPATEADEPRTPVPENEYFESKVRMEKALQAIALELGNSLIVIRPGWMFAPGDNAPTAAGELVIQLLCDGSLQMVGGSPLNTVDARDVAQTTVAALTKADGYEIFNVAGYPVRAIDTLRSIAEAAGNGAKVSEVPLPAALFLGAVLEPITRLQNKPNPIPRVGLLTLRRGVPISSQKAETQLGATFRPFAETARDTVAFFREAFAAQIAKR